MPQWEGLAPLGRAALVVSERPCPFCAPAGTVILELSKEKTNERLLDRQAAAFTASVQHVEAELSAQIRYLTQVCRLWEVWYTHTAPCLNLSIQRPGAEPWDEAAHVSTRPTTPFQELSLPLSIKGGPAHFTALTYESLHGELLGEGF